MVVWYYGIVAYFIITPIYCREGSDPAENRHRIHRKPHGIKTLQPGATLHDRLRAAGNDLTNVVSQPPVSQPR